MNCDEEFYLKHVSTFAMKVFSLTKEARKEKPYHSTPKSNKSRLVGKEGLIY